MPHTVVPLIGKVLDLLLDAVCVVDRDGRFVFVSAAAERIFGYTPAEMIGRPMIELVLPEDRPRTLAAAAEIMAGVPAFHFRNRYLRKDGRVVHIMWSATWSPDDQVRIAVARDVSEITRAEARQTAMYAVATASQTANDLPTLLRNVHEIIGSLLPSGELAIALRDPLSGQLQLPYVASPGVDPLLLADLLARCTATPGAAEPATMPTRRALPGGDWLVVTMRSGEHSLGALAIRSASAAVRYDDADRELLQYIAAQVATAVIRKRHEIELEYSALHDPLTGLANRQLFNDRLARALARARRRGNQVALLFIDLDGFKQVNDQHGHATGDLLLREVAQRLQRCVRDSDTTGRIGGDEFVVVLEALAAPDSAAVVAEKIRDTLAQRYAPSGHALHVSASIGIAVFPDHGDDAEQLMRLADAAMYAAKHGGRDRVVLAQPSGRRTIA